MMKSCYIFIRWLKDIIKSVMKRWDSVYICTHEDMHAHYLGALFIDDVIRHNTLITTYLSNFSLSKSSKTHQGLSKIEGLACI